MATLKNPRDFNPVSLTSQSTIFVVTAVSIIITAAVTFAYIQYTNRQMRAPRPRSRSQSPPRPCSLCEPPSSSRYSSSRHRLPLLDRLRPKWLRRKEPERDPEEHPPVYCVEDLETPPPTYQRSRRAPPDTNEMWNLHQRLDVLKASMPPGTDPREILLRETEAVNLKNWIKELEGIAQREQREVAFREAAVRPPPKAQMPAREMGRNHRSGVTMQYIFRNRRDD